MTAIHRGMVTLFRALDSGDRLLPRSGRVGLITIRQSRSRLSTHTHSRRVLKIAFRGILAKLESCHSGRNAGAGVTGLGAGLEAGVRRADRRSGERGARCVWRGLHAARKLGLLSLLTTSLAITLGASVDKGLMSPGVSCGAAYP